MEASVRSFNDGLYCEHLETAGFLYTMRTRLLTLPEPGWRRVGDWDLRLERHLDALCIGAARAEALVAAQVSAGDPEAVFVGGLLACRQRSVALLREVLAVAGRSGGPCVAALADALKLGLPEQWHAFLVRALGQRNDPALAALIVAAGFHRIDCAAALLPLANDQELLPACMRALSRLDPSKAIDVFERGSRSSDPATRYCALVGLALSGDRHAEVSIDTASADPIALLVRSMIGGRNTVRALHVQAASGQPAAQAAVGIGLQGDASGLPVLLALLENPLSAAAAAESLYLITGLRITEDGFVAEAPDPDAMFDHEREHFEQTGEAPARPDGRPYGTRQQRVCRSPAAWRGALAEKKGQFREGRRYRLGRPIDAAAIVDALNDSIVHPKLRSLLIDELRLRYGVTSPLEPDDWVARQSKQLQPLRDMLVAAGVDREPGAWLRRAYRPEVPG